MTPRPPVRPTETLDLADGDSLALTAAAVRRRVGNRVFVQYGFNGQSPGPMIRVARGATITVGFHNETPLPTAIHWHGVRLDNRFDGVPHVTQDPVPPGGTFRYEVTFPDAGIYWYHPHHREDVLQDAGLVGNLLVRPDRADWLPPANREIALVLDDLLLADDGPVPWGDEAATHALAGRFGNVLTVNGEPDWTLDADEGEVVRLWITNVASTRTFNVSLPGATMKLLGSDNGLYEREEFVESLVIAPAERLIVDVRFDKAGAVPLINAVKAVDHVYGGIVAEVDTLGTVTVGPDAAAEDHTNTFVTLRENEEVIEEVNPHRARLLDPPDAELILTLEVGDVPFPIGPMMRLETIYAHPIEWSGTMPGMNQASTARQIRWILKDPATGQENEEIHWNFEEGDLVKLRLTGDQSSLHRMHHPIHVHGQRMLVLSTNGRPTANMAWKDTVVVPAGGVVDVLVEMSNPGDWMLHCHIAEHLEAGMRTVFRVESKQP